MRGARSLVNAAILVRGLGALSSGLFVSALSVAPAWAETAVNRVRDVRIRAADHVDGGAEIDVVGTAQATFDGHLADGGRHLYIDLAGSEMDGAPEALTTPVGVVGGVLTQTFGSGSTRMTRLTISLLGDSTYRVIPSDTSLRIVIVPRAAPPSEIAAPLRSQPLESVVRDIRFEHAAPKSAVCAPGACDRIVVELSAIPTYSLSTPAPGRLRLDLRATSLPESLARSLDVHDYGGLLRKVRAWRDETSGNTSIELERAAGDGPGTISVEGGSLAWSFPALSGSAPGAPVQVHIDGRSSGPDGGPARRVATVAREPAPVAMPRIDSSIHESDANASVETQASGTAGFASGAGDVFGQQRYTGRRIDIDLKDADIHNVLRLLADTGHVNIVTADDVGGNITIRMRNVPWDQVLSVVLEAKNLGMIRQGNLIRVAPMAQLQKERELKLAAQKQEYELTPLETRLIPVSYAHADELQARAKELLSPRGSIAVDERTNVLIARDIAGNLNYIEELVRSLDTQTAQVLIEARIVEATSKYLRDVGIQWGGDYTASAATGNPTGIAFPSSIAASGGAYDNNTPTAGLSPFSRTVATPNFAVNLPAAVGTGTGGALGISLGSIDNTLNLAVRLSAAESSGLVRIVSAPRVMVLDNREARINQGTLIPFSQVSALGVQTTFQEAKLQLLVRPHVTADGSISMHVKLNRDEPDFNQTSARGDPTILKREAETDLLVMDGHTAVIGGIYTRNTGRNLDQVPFFGDIPILGVLFQRRRASDSRNELVIFITPRIVNRSEALGR
jgi:type IV pilus assembly protein PilQ